MRNDERISRYANYCGNKFIYQVDFGHGTGKLSYSKLLKNFKKYDDEYNRISEASDNNNGECYLGKISGHINKLYKISEQQFLIKNKKNKFSDMTN